MADLGGGHERERGLVGDRRGQRGVGREALEGHELGVGEHARAGRRRRRGTPGRRRGRRARGVRVAGAVRRVAHGSGAYVVARPDARVTRRRRAGRAPRARGGTATGPLTGRLGAVITGHGRRINHLRDQPADGALTGARRVPGVADPSADPGTRRAQRHDTAPRPTHGARPLSRPQTDTARRAAIDPTPTHDVEAPRSSSPRPSPSSASTPTTVEALAERRHHHRLPHPGAHPPARPRRQRHHRPGQDRHRQDPRLRHPGAPAPHRPRRRGLRRRSPTPSRASRRRSSSSRPASSASRSRATCRRPAAMRGVRVLCVYGGRAYEPQVEALQKGIEVVVGTPGRLIDLAQPGPPRPQARQDARPRRGRRDARHGLPARRRAHRRARPAGAPDDALLGHDAGPDRRPRAPLHDAADAHPRDRPRRRQRARSTRSSSTSTARTASTRSRCSPASCRPTAAA